jgi:N6-L-threonylcarbamoyladenine synthase
MNILAIETSCDETAVAVVKNGTEIISSVVSTSADMNQKWGGVVPEVAARKQLEYMIPALNETLSQSPDFDAIAVTVGPGLVGSLLVGVETAKTIALVTGKPIIPVNHVLAHIYANLVPSSWFMVHGKESKNTSKLQTINNKLRTMNQEPIFPAISLVASGGHTELYLMTSAKELKWLGGTIDDAAGEAFDKTARVIGLGSAGGAAIEKAAAKVYGSSFMVHGKANKKSSELRTMNHEPLSLPRPLIHDKTLNFSFSGLKTAVMREWHKRVDSSWFMVQGEKPKKTYEPKTINHELRTMTRELTSVFAFEIQEAITDVMVHKTLKAAQIHSAKSILLSGGVAANTRLREKFNQELKTTNYELFAPPPALCTDNAVSAAAYAYFRGQPEELDKIKVQPDLSAEI